MLTRWISAGNPASLPTCCAGDTVPVMVKRYVKDFKVVNVTRVTCQALLRLPHGDPGHRVLAGPAQGPRARGPRPGHSARVVPWFQDQGGGGPSPPRPLPSPPPQSSALPPHPGAEQGLRSPLCRRDSFQVIWNPLGAVRQSRSQPAERGRHAEAAGILADVPARQCSARSAPPEFAGPQSIVPV